MKPKKPLNIGLKVLLKNFHNSLSKPQRIHFETMVSGMILSSKKSILKYSNFSSKNQSSLNRFMKSKSVDNSKILSNHFKNINQYLDDKKDSYLIMDDNISHHKHAKKIEGVGLHHDHLQNGFSLGHSVVTSGILNGKIFFPLESNLYIKKSDIRDVSDFKSKIEMAEEMIISYVKKFSLKAVLIDSWYSAKSILKKILNNKLDFFTMLKSNRKVTFNKRKKQVNEHFEDLKEEDFEEIFVNKKLHKIASKKVYFKGVGKIRVLFSQQFDEKKEEFGQVHYLTTNNLTISPKEILETYSSRWPIEVNNRDVKQNLGFEKSIVRNLIAIKRHFLLCNITQTFVSITKRLRSKKSSSGKVQNLLKIDLIQESIGKYGLHGETRLLCAKEIVAVL